MSFIHVPLSFALIEILTDDAGLIKNFPTDRFPYQKAGSDLLVHRAQPSYMGLVHPTAASHHDAENETLEGLKFISQPERDE
jgi:hypothetical protein